MEFSVVERLLLLQILPVEGDITTLRITRKLQEELSFSEEEHGVLKFAHTFDQATGNHQTKWQDEDKVKKDIEIGPRAHVLVVDTLTKLDKEKKLRIDHISLCEKFGVGE